MSRRFDLLSPQPVSTTEGYAQAFAKKEHVVVTDLCGRILRGKHSYDFDSLTDDTSRKIVMLMGPDGLSMMSTKNGYEMLTTIGYTREYIEQKLSSGTLFKLAVLPKSNDAAPATWNNVIDIVSRAYPETKYALERHYRELANSKFEDMQRKAGYNFSEVDIIGPTHPRYMTIERFLESSKNVADTRAFLYFTVYLKELFSGDGYTYTHEGVRGLQEFIALNKPLANFGKTTLLDIEI